MSDQKKTTAPLSDGDMHALFNKDSTRVPAELDASILRAAHAQAHSDHNQPSRVPGSSDNAERPVKSGGWMPVWPRALATAAVVLLAVLVVPLMLSTPESSLDEELLSTARSATASASDEVMDVNQVNNIASKNVSSATRLESIPMQSASRGTTSSAATLSEIESEQEAPLVEEEYSMVDDESVNNSTAANRKEESTLEANTSMMPNRGRDKTLPRYRESPTAWFNEIIRLFEADDLDRARTEAVEFVKSHPNSDLLNKLPDTLRK